MSSEDNQIKAQHGVNAKRTLEYAVVSLEDYGAITESVSKPTYGYRGHDETQFKADKEVTSADGTKSILFTTNSIRTDRVKGQQWDAYNIKKIDNRIENAFIIVPDNDALDTALSFRERLRNGALYSAIDDIMTVEEFYEYVVERYGALLSSGVRHDLEGRNFEDLFAAVLGNRENLSRYNGEESEVGYMYELFASVMHVIGVGRKEATAIYATTDIPKLPSGGSPKTDVLARIVTASGTSNVTFSLKDSSNAYVSVHQYSADDFADVLDPNNDDLRRALKAFQQAGSARDMEPEDKVALTRELHPHLMDLDMWVFGGYGADNVRDEQVAQFLVTKMKGTTDIKIHEVESYCAMQERMNNGNKGFGTIFQWTYASGSRGKSIQLKAKIIM